MNLRSGQKLLMSTVLYPAAIIFVGICSVLCTVSCIHNFVSVLTKIL